MNDPSDKSVPANDIECAHCWDRGHAKRRCPWRALSHAEAMEQNQRGRRILLIRRNWVIKTMARFLQNIPRASWDEAIGEVREFAEWELARKKAPAKRTVQLPMPLSPLAVEVDQIARDIEEIEKKLQPEPPGRVLRARRPKPRA
jgi:hypothetical protein